MRCDECVEAILRLNTARITRLLLEEPYVPERLSERLATDLDAGVAMAASERLGLERIDGAASTGGARAPVGTEAVSPFATTIELTTIELTVDELTVDELTPASESDHDMTDARGPQAAGDHAAGDQAAGDWSEW